GRPPLDVLAGVVLHPSHIRLRVDDGLMMLNAHPDPGLGRDQAALLGGRGQEPPRCHAGVSLPPAIFEQSPPGRSTNDLPSRACVAWPAQECAPSAQSFFETALMP